MKKIVLIGAGNVAYHLFAAFEKTKNIKVIQMYNRGADKLKYFENKTQTISDFDLLKPADAYIVAVSDRATRELISHIGDRDVLVAHTSGSVPMLNSAKRNGVFYPLQTFSKQIEVNFSEIPVCIEAETPKDLEILRILGESISEKVYPISSEQRKKLHLAAVFACNFTNHLYRIAEKICEQNDVPFAVLHALIKETARKIEMDSPKNTQTGPAVRRDQSTIALHLEQLESPDLKEIYTLLTRSIQEEND